MAITNPELIKQLIEEYGWERVAVALDYSRGKLKLKGWKKVTKFKVIPTISKFRRIGCRYFILTSIDKDGTLSGPDVELLAKVAKLGNIIAAGGVMNIGDIVKLKRMGIYGLILGRALYEGKIKLKEAIKVAGDAS
jgi:phosphoribosylformimino-5-aminoimidazole carboxamide ribotide isomerase